MQRIPSFSIDHTRLERGIYLSRQDDDVKTWDVRIKEPNHGDYLSNGVSHTIEHLFATYARNSEYKDGVIYIGPMGCRTGNYLLLNGDYESKDIVPLMIETFEFIRDFKGEVPGASARDCGNYLDMNLGMANYLAGKYLSEVLYNITEDRLVYPQ